MPAPGVPLCWKLGRSSEPRRGSGRFCCKIGAIEPAELRKTVEVENPQSAAPQLDQAVLFQFLQRPADVDRGHAGEIRHILLRQGKVAAIVVDAAVGGQTAE